MKRRISLNRLTQKFILIFFGAFLALIFFARGAGAATYYVDDTGGLDGNPGTLAQPWQTVAKVNSTIANGDTIYFKYGGVWRESPSITKSNITVDAYGGDNSTLPKFLGTKEKIGVAGDWTDAGAIIGRGLLRQLKWRRDRS